MFTLIIFDIWYMIHSVAKWFVMVWWLWERNLVWRRRHTLDVRVCVCVSVYWICFNLALNITFIMLWIFQAMHTRFATLAGRIELNVFFFGLDSLVLLSLHLCSDGKGLLDWFDFIFNWFNQFPVQKKMYSISKAWLTMDVLHNPIKLRNFIELEGNSMLSI